MKTDVQIHETYSDFLESDDADLVPLVRDLDIAYAMPCPRKQLAVLEPPASGKFMTRPKRQFTATRRWRPNDSWTHRLGSLAAVLLAMVILAGTGFAVLPLMNRAFDEEPGTRSILQEGLGEELNLSHTAEGFTLKILRAYADVNRVVVGYEVSGPPNREIDLAVPIFNLTDSTGHQLPERHTAISGVGADTGGFASWFDASGIKGTPPQLKLQLQASTIKVWERTRPERADDDAPGISDCNGPESPFRCTDVQGPLVFNFTVPFRPGRATDLHLEATAGGKTMTLERVVVSQTETRLYMRGADEGRYMKLSVGGWDSSSYNRSGAQGIWDVGDGVKAFSFPVPLYDKHGEWTLVVGASMLDKQRPRRGEEFSGEVWRFHFTVP